MKRLIQVLIPLLLGAALLANIYRTDTGRFGNEVTLPVLALQRSDGPQTSPPMPVVVAQGEHSETLLRVASPFVVSRVVNQAGREQRRFKYFPIWAMDKDTTQVTVSFEHVNHRARARFVVGEPADVLFGPIGSDMVRFVMAGMLCVLGVMAIGFHFAHLAPRAVFYAGAFGAICGVSEIAGTHLLRFFLGDEALWDWVLPIAVMVEPIALAYFAIEVLGDLKYRPVRAASMLCTVWVVGGILLHLLGLVALREAMMWDTLVVIPGTVAGLALVIVRAREGNREADVFLVGFCLLCAFTVPDILTENDIAPLTGTTSYIGLFVFTAGLGLTLLSRERRSQLQLTGRLAEVQTLNDELRRQVAERGRELAQALSGVLSPGAGNHVLERGDVFDGRYTVHALLGQGGMGTVYEVERKSDGSRLALKLMKGPVSPQAAARFAREAEIAARLSHPGLVGVVDVGVHDTGTLFLAMELVRGGSLAEGREKLIASGQLLPTLGKVAEALSYLHANGVVHRDLKPANVLLGWNGATPFVKISDFGISRFDGHTPPPSEPKATPHLTDVGNADTLAKTSPSGNPLALTGTGVLMGTPLYMAPELRHGGKDALPSSDLYSFGLMACELVLGRFPYPAPPLLEVMSGRDIPPLPPLGLPGPIEQVLRAALDLIPEGRPTAETLSNVLQQKI